MTRALAAVTALAACTAGCAHRSPLLDPSSRRFTATAPDSFDVQVVTTKGTLVVRARRDWAPHGVDRFHALVRNRFFDNVAFHRTMRGYVAQFGISGDSAVSRAWLERTIPDDPVRATNHRGALSFARPTAPNSRGTQLFFNLADNTPRLDTLGGIGFAPVGEVTQGIEVLDALNTEYSSTPGVRGPDQDSLRLQGNAYLARSFPRLDYIVQARVVRAWGR